MPISWSGVDWYNMGRDIASDHRTLLADLKAQRSEIIVTYHRTLQRLDELIARLEQEIKRTTQ